MIILSPREPRNVNGNGISFLLINYSTPAGPPECNGNEISFLLINYAAPEGVPERNEKYSFLWISFVVSFTEPKKGLKDFSGALRAPDFLCISLYRAKREPKSSRRVSRAGFPLDFPSESQERA